MRQHLKRVCRVVLVFASFCVAGCQSSPQFIPALDDDPIKAGDVLLVSGSGNWNGGPFTARWIVDASGNVKLPYAHPWRAAGKRPSELAKELSRYFSVGRSVTFTIEKLGGAFPTQRTASPVPPPQPLRVPVGPARGP